MERRHPNQPTQIDTLFACLSDHHRRLIIRTLSDEATPITVEELTQRIAENGATVAEEDPQEIAVSLHHVHLPKLDEADIVDVDRELNTVREDDRFETTESLLDEVS